MDLMELLEGIHFPSNMWVFLLPIAMIALDIATGLTKAFVHKDFQSAKMRSGFGKKIGEIAVLVIGELISYGLGLPKIIMIGVSLYLVFMELMSNMENLKALGVPLPKWIMDSLSQVDSALQTGKITEIQLPSNASTEEIEKFLKELDRIKK